MAEVAALEHMEPAPPGGPAVAGRSPWALAGRRLARNRIALGGLVLFALIVVVSFAAPIYSNDIAHVNPFQNNLNGFTIVKLFLNLSKEEQRTRFMKRIDLAEKNWKFSHADLTTRQHWDSYIDAYEDMLNATSHAAAPWHLVPADRNWYRDHVIATAAVRAMERLHLKWPKSSEDLSKVKIR